LITKTDKWQDSSFYLLLGQKSVQTVISLNLLTLPGVSPYIEMPFAEFILCLRFVKNGWREMKLVASASLAAALLIMIYCSSQSMSKSIWYHTSGLYFMTMDSVFSFI